MFFHDFYALCSFRIIPYCLLSFPLSFVRRRLREKLGAGSIRLSKVNVSHHHITAAEYCILRRMSKSFWAIIAAIIVIFGGILFFKGRANAPTNASGKPGSHLIGTSPAGVTLVEFGDYQCPYCGQFSPVVKQVQQKYNDKIVFQFRNLPLSQVHQNAFAAARVAEAAGLQGKYWQMHDLLYENQSAWSESSNAQDVFNQYASALKLNVNQFKIDAASSQVNDAINKDIADFLKTGNEESTPTFLLDGKKITPDFTIDTFSKYIDAELKAKSQS